MEAAARAIGLWPVEGCSPSGGPLLAEDESVLTKFEAVQLVLGSDADQGEGSLFITEGRVIWLSTEGALGFAADFPTITMHAVSTDPESFGKPCLYVQLDMDDEEEEESEEEEEEDSQAAAAAAEQQEGASGPAAAAAPSGQRHERLSPELRLIPADPTQLDAIFEAFCKGAERNPDDGEEEEGAGGGFFYDIDAALAGAVGAGLGMSDDEHEEPLAGDQGRFEDADYDEESEQQQQQRQPNGSA